MFDFEARVLIDWLANTLSSQPIRTCASISSIFVFGVECGVFMLMWPIFLSASKYSYYTRAGNVRQAYFEIYPFRAPYSKSTVENCKSFGAVRIGYLRYISKDLIHNQFFCQVIPTSLNPSL